MIGFILCALVALVTLVLGIKWCVTFIKEAIPSVSFEKLWKRLLIVIGIFSISLTGMFCFIYLWNKITPNTREILSTIFGGLFFGLFASTSLFTFMLHYYAKGDNKGINQTADKWMFRTLAVSFPVMFVFLFLLTDGFANYLTYPLVNGINFTHGFVRPTSNESPNLAFYALCIISGAIYVYLLCDHKFYLEYGKHGIIESTFFVAFPAGIIGARIFYVIGNWNVEFANQEFWHVFAFWEGGLTILGGAITGIVVGVAWFMWRNKGYNIFLAIDIIVPTILIAQGVGRWGNFFNCEVHGIEMAVKYWDWLPDVIVKNMQYSSTEGWASSGNIFVPLFLIEGIVNFLGYFVLAHLFGVKLRKYTQLGDLAFGYVAWYGMTRVLMEPLRDTSFNMGSNGYWSWIWSLIFVIAGFLMIAVNHFVRFLLTKKALDKEAKKDKIAQTICVSVIGIALLVAGIILMNASNFVATLSFNKFNIGVILLALGVSALLCLLITIPPLIKRQHE